MMANVIPRETAYAVLMRMPMGGSPIATHFLASAAGCAGDAAKLRRFMLKLRGAGLVEGVEGRSGRVFWWKITEAGNRFLRTFAPGACEGDRPAARPDDSPDDTQAKA